MDPCVLGPRSCTEEVDPFGVVRRSFKRPDSALTSYGPGLRGGLGDGDGNPMHCMFVDPERPVSVVLINPYQTYGNSVSIQ